MFTPTHLLKQSVPYLVLGVQICFLAQYTIYDVGKVGQVSGLYSRCTSRYDDFDKR